jgi:hypothetical protein
MKKGNAKMRLKRHVANAQAVGNVIANSLPTSPSEVQRIMVAIRLSYERLKTGAGTQDDLGRVGATINVGVIRAEVIDEQLVDAFKAAGEALLACARIHQRHGKYGFHGQDLLAMNAAMDLYEQLLSLSSPNQMHEAAREGERRIAAGDIVTA